MKNIIRLVAFALITFTLAFAKEPIEKESMEEAENFKLEKVVKEKKAGRAFAGAKAKKEKHGDEPAKEDFPSAEDSEVRYWKYSE